MRVSASGFGGGTGVPLPSWLDGLRWLLVSGRWLRVVGFGSGQGFRGGRDRLTSRLSGGQQECQAADPGEVVSRDAKQGAAGTVPGAVAFPFRSGPFLRAPVLLLYGIALVEVENRFQWLPQPAWLLAAGLALIALATFRSRVFRRKFRWQGVLLVAVLAALSFRIPLERGVTGESTGAARAADRVDAWLADLTQKIGDAARLMARTPTIAAAVEGSDALDYRGQAFATLVAWRLPDTGIGPSSATLHDRRLDPVAWSGNNPGIGAALREIFPEGIRDEDCPEPRQPLFFFTEEGRRGTLVAAECLRNRLGLVTVEAPVSEQAPPASGEPSPSALEVAGRRGMTVQFLRGAEDATGLARLFALRGEHFREGSGGSLEYFLALRAYDTQLLGVANTLIAPPRVREAERRAEAQMRGALVLFSGALAAIALLWNSGFAGRMTAIPLLLFGGGAVLRVCADRFPETDVFAAGGGMLPAIPGVPDSPAGALLVSVAALAAMRVFQVRGPRRASAPGTWFHGIPNGIAAGSFAVAAGLLLREIGAAGDFPLAPRWQVETGVAEIIGWFALIAMSAALLVGCLLSLRRSPGAHATAWGTVLLGGLMFSPAVALAAAAPLAGALLVRRTSRGRLWMRQLRQPLGRKEPGLAFLLALGLFATPPLLLLPAMEWFEEASRQAYAEAVAPTQIARHRFQACHAAVEAAAELGEADLATVRADTAWRLWRATGLPRLNLASALTVEAPAGAVSRFSVGFPRQAAEMPRTDPGGTDPDDVFRECAASEQETVHLDGTLSGGARFGLTVAVRATDVPLVARPNAIADHFLFQSRGAPAVFDGRDLRLESAGIPAAANRHLISITVDDHSYRISWRRTGFAGFLAALFGWLFLAVVLALIPALAVRVRLLFARTRSRRVRRSFRMQLTEAFGAAVLVAVLGLSVFGEQRMEAVLDAASDQDAVQHARTAERVARAVGALDPGLARSELEFRLARAADQVDADIALYESGRLLGASRPALALAGFLPPHPAVGAIRLADPAVAAPHLDFLEVGPLRYRIAWIRLPETSPERFLAVPLPAIQAAREAGARAFQHTLVLAAGVVALLCAVLLPGFMARRLAAPVRSLARATDRIADGALDTSVPRAGEVDEMRLLAASVERLVRRIPRVRRRMREEATADLARQAAHDIKNALAPIEFTADYMGRVAGDPRGQDVRDAVREGSRDILLQVDRLRRISTEFSAVGAPLRIEEVDLEALIRRTIGPYLRTPGPPHITLSAERVPPIRADPEILVRIVENLLQNAMEALDDADRDDGLISVRLGPHPVEGRVRIEVEDNGPGVAEELRERVFDAAFSTRTRGSGLGLANTRRFTEAHGGVVRADARSDGNPGLLVIVELPVRGPAP